MTTQEPKMTLYNYNRQAAAPSDLERPAQDVLNMCKELYMLVGRIEERAKTMKQLYPLAAAEVFRYLPQIDTDARKMYRGLVEELHLD